MVALSAPTDSPTHQQIRRPAPVEPYPCHRDAIRLLTDPAPVTLADLAELWDARRGRYRNTYSSCLRTKSWRARVVKNVNLPGRYPSDREAAKAVVRWLRGWYGPEWQKAFRNLRANRGYARLAGGGGNKFRAVVYVRGEAVTVYRDVLGGSAAAWEMDSPEEARRAIRAWLARHRERYGPYARLLLWRA